MRDSIERLLNLVAAFLDSGRPIASSVLQRQVFGYSDMTADTFRRTFARDRKVLAEVGITISAHGTADDKTERWTLSRGDEPIPAVEFTDSEVVALRMAISMARIDVERTDGIFLKLGFLGPTEAHCAIDAEGDTRLLTIHDAIRARDSVLTFAYRGQTRRLWPRRATLRGINWSVQGLDLDKQGLRSFRLDRIEGEILVTKSNQDLHWDGVLPDPEPAASERIRLRVPTSMCDGFVRNWRATVLTSGSETCDVEIEVVDTWSLLDLVIGMADRVELIEPQALRERLANHFASMAESYSVVT